MTDVERYEKTLKGKQFTIPCFNNDIIYTFGDCHYKKYHHSVDIIISGKPHNNGLVFVLRNIDDGSWKLYLNDERKLKLKKLLKND